jgi:hypothetical protein
VRFYEFNKITATKGLDRVGKKMMLTLIQN